jgi:predicted TIM-barrel fold metal-dependent hydrolase
MLWSTNFPQPTSTWPESRHAIDRSFEGIPDSDRRQILVDNPARLYNLKL